MVEDEKTNQMVAKSLLKRLGYDVELATNGEEAVQTLTQRGYDLVLMDCQMPVMDGFAATRHIRRNDSGVINPAIPIIALTANAQQSDRDACLESGMNDYLSKPIDLATLKSKLESWYAKENPPV